MRTATIEAVLIYKPTLGYADCHFACAMTLARMLPVHCALVKQFRLYALTYGGDDNEYGEVHGICD